MLAGAMASVRSCRRTRAIRFHAEWEKSVLGVTLASAALGYWNIDASRHARESLPPAIYFGASYYEIWLRGLEIAVSSVQERFRRRNSPTGRAHRARPSGPTDRISGDQVRFRRFMAKGGPTERPGPAPRFGIGRPGPHVAITSRRVTPGCPDTRGAGRAIVTALHGSHVYPDTNAHFEGEQPRPLYTVRFDADGALRLKDADPTLSVSIDAWEPYLESSLKPRSRNHGRRRSFALTVALNEGGSIHLDRVGGRVFGPRVQTRRGGALLGGRGRRRLWHCWRRKGIAAASEVS
jgi:hypothetical protein